MSTLPTSNPKAEAKTKVEACIRIKHNILQQLHFFGVLTVKTIASALLITVLLWLFARLPDPQVHVTSFRIESLINPTAKPPSTIINYDFTIHNPDLYKSVNYIVLFLRIFYSGNYSENGAIVDFEVGEKGLTQRPGKTDVLSKHTLDYSYHNLGYLSDSGQLSDLKIDPEQFIILTFVMEVRVMAFNKVIASRQMTKNANLYFDEAGNAIIDHPGGLAFR